MKAAMTALLAAVLVGMTTNFAYAAGNGDVDDVTMNVINNSNPQTVTSNIQLPTQASPEAAEHINGTADSDSQDTDSKADSDNKVDTDAQADTDNTADADADAQATAQEEANESSHADAEEQAHQAMQDAIDASQSQADQAMQDAVDASRSKDH